MQKYFEKIVSPLNIQMRYLSNAQVLIETALFSVISFSLPFLIGQPQFVIGTVVNFMLFRSSLYLKNVRLIPLLILPSLGALSRGIVFGPFTYFLVIYLPFIWISNFILVFSFRKIKTNLFLSVFFAAILKSSLLFVVTLFLNSINIVQENFLKSMGIIQLFTAVFGGIFMILFTKIENKLLKRQK